MPSAVNLGQVIRTQQTTNSIYQADLVIETTELTNQTADAGPAAIIYDEWNGQRRCYRPAHCRVFEEVPTSVIDADQLHQITTRLRHRLRLPIQQLRSAFLAMFQTQRLRSGQRQGVELDLDAFVTGRAQVIAGGQMPEKIWWARRPRQRELAVLVLIDTSLSADSWVNGRRVLDVARQACFMLTEVLSGVGVELAIAAFNSFTRHDCRYLKVKEFGQPLASAQARLFGLQPQGFTRIGPALRHATAQLSQSRARRQLLLVLSDGKATDQDHYEGRYGTADVRQAVREAAQQGIDCLALAIEKEARHYLPALFGRSGFEVMPKPELPPERLAIMLERCLVKTR